MRGEYTYQNIKPAVIVFSEDDVAAEEEDGVFNKDEVALVTADVQRKREDQEERER